MQRRKNTFAACVNPMRRRSETPSQGYCELCLDILAFAGLARDMVDKFWTSCARSDDAVQSLLDDMMSVPGFGGSGFRSKELLCDFVDMQGLFMDGAKLQRVYVFALQAHHDLVFYLGRCHVVTLLKS